MSNESGDNGMKRTKEKGWSVHKFTVISGSPVCTVEALRCGGQLLLWIGSLEEARLGDVALAMPAEGRAAMSTALIGEDDGIAPALAQRLSAALGTPVYVCCGLKIDRLNAPIIERALVSEIKSRPDIFT